MPLGKTCEVPRQRFKSWRGSRASPSSPRLLAFAGDPSGCISVARVRGCPSAPEAGSIPWCMFAVRKRKVVEEKGIARLSLGHPGHRLLRRGFGLTRSRASRFSPRPVIDAGDPSRREYHERRAGLLLVGARSRFNPLPDVGGDEKKVVEEKGIEPSTPTLRTWCSPS